MATQTGTTLKTYFNTGDKPTEAQFADLIDSNLNLTDGGTSTGTVNLQSDTPLVFTSGSTTDDFYAIAPPMIRGLIPGLKVWDLFSDSLGTELPTDDSTTTSPWLFDNASGTVAKTNNDVDFDEGAITITTGGSENDQIAIFTKATSFKCIAGTKWWAEAEFKVSDQDATELFFGVLEEVATTTTPHLTALGDGADRVGFVKKVHNNDAVEYAVNKGSAGTIGSALTGTALALDTDNDILHLGIYWDGSNVKFYTGAVRATGAARGALTLNTTVASNIPDDSNLGLVLYVQTGEAGANIVVVNKLRGAIWS